MALSSSNSTEFDRIWAQLLGNPFIKCARSDLLCVIVPTSSSPLKLLTTLFSYAARSPHAVYLRKFHIICAFQSPIPYEVAFQGSDFWELGAQCIWRSHILLIPPSQSRT